jgi:hypothetical protein
LHIILVVWHIPIYWEFPSNVWLFYAQKNKHLFIKLSTTGSSENYINCCNVIIVQIWMIDPLSVHIFRHGFYFSAQQNLSAAWAHSLLSSFSRPYKKFCPRQRRVVFCRLFPGLTKNLSAASALSFLSSFSRPYKKICPRQRRIVFCRLFPALRHKNLSAASAHSFLSPFSGLNKNVAFSIRF